MLARLPSSGRQSPAPHAVQTSKPFLLLALLSACAACLLIIEAFVLRKERHSRNSPLVLINEDESDNNIKEDSFAGLVFSTDRLRYGPNGDSYWFALTRQPLSNVTVRIEDPSKCTTTTRSLHIEFTPEDWERPRRIKASFSIKQGGMCPQGLVHACDSLDSSYDGFHVRLWVDFPPEMTRSDEKTGEWVPEEVLEAEEEGPQVALANLERSRSAFNFKASEFRCRSVREERDKLQCVIGYGTAYETPFYVIDPKNGVDDDGWNGFPVVLIVGGSHGNEAAGVGAAIHVAQYMKPRRGRLIIVPYANMRGLKAGVRTIPHADHKSEADLNRNFPLDEDPQGDLAHALWNLIYKIRPDVLFDLHEGWGFYAKTKNNFHKTLVNSKSFSKGSSVICTEDAHLLARSIINKINDESLAPEKRFEIISPPIAGGLAMKMNREFQTRAILTETTKTDQALALRVSQHLKMVTAGLVAVNVLPHDVDESNYSNTKCVLVVPYGKEFSQGSCLEEKDGILNFNAPPSPP